MTRFTFQFVFLISIVLLLGVSVITYRSLKNLKSDGQSLVKGQYIKEELSLLTEELLKTSRYLRNVILAIDTLGNSDLLEAEAQINRHLMILDSLSGDIGQYDARLDQLIVDINDLQHIIKQITSHRTTLDDRHSLIIREERLLSKVLITIENIKQTVNLSLAQRSGRLISPQFLAPVSFLTLVIIAVCFICFLFYNTFGLYKENESKAAALTDKVKRLNLEIRKSGELWSLLQTIFESSQHGIIAFDSVRDHEGKITDFKFRLVNAEGAKVLGENVDSLKDKHLLNVVPGNKEIGLFDIYVNVVETGTPYRDVQYYNYDNIDLWFDISAVKNGDGFVVTFIDVSNIKNYERSLLEKKKELEVTNQELEQFAYIASHDLQEPLRKIRAFGERLTSKFSAELGAKGKDYIERMQNASERMQILIEDLLKISRVSRAAPEFQHFDLNLALRDALDNLDLEISNKKATVEVKDLPVVYGERLQFTQLFQNLISNALKYAKENIPPEIVISSIETTLDKAAQGEVFWKISVTDNGIGFDPEYEKQIFHIFERLHGRDEYGGTGIGLAICEKIITNHHGFIEAKSRPGEGTIFSFYIPDLSELELKTDDLADER